MAEKHNIKQGTTQQLLTGKKCLPGFSGEWGVQKLGSCLIKNPEYGINAPAVPYSDNLPVYIRITDISEDGRFLPEKKVSVNHPLSANYVLEANDLLLARTGASTGKSYLYNSKDGKLVFAGYLIRVKVNPEKLDAQYLKGFLQTKTYWNWVGGMSMRSGQPGINGNEYAQLPIPLPPTLEEQKAIAQALSDADATIAELDGLITKKRNIKQGATQQLLTGKKRLPGFSGEWGLQKLGSCLIKNPEYGINASAVPYSDNLPVYIRITDISEDGKFLRAQKVSVNHPQSANYLLETNDLVIARTGASTGKSYLYNPQDGELIFAGFLIKVKVNPQKLDARYLKGFLQSKAYWNWVTAMSMRSGQPGINGNEYAQLPIPLPPTLEEQRAIAQVLTDMDAEIEALEQKRDKYQAIKQGMIQELLTGRTRLI